MKMPSLFIAHGAPTLALEDNAYTQFLEELAAKLPKPKAIVVISAHWESNTQMISTAAQHEMMYDFYGFPQEMYEIRYPAKGDPELAHQIHDLLANAGIASGFDDSRGIDHGVWVPLYKVFPDANIPVVAMSVNSRLPIEQQYRIGQALEPLREQGVLIIGSGGTSHNLRRVEWNSTKPTDWAVAFEQWMTKTLQSWDTEALFDLWNRAPHSRDAAPTPEHFVPSVCAMGAADQGKHAEQMILVFQYGNLSLTVWKFD